ncbi:MAG: hypothetical protein KAI83_07675, partial [Thiomargarita sp.]|nr:hypothetical protein [Thiomargarita sp.]
AKSFSCNGFLIKKWCATTLPTLHGYNLASQIIEWWATKRRCPPYSATRLFLFFLRQMPRSNLLLHLTKYETILSVRYQVFGKKSLSSWVLMPQLE